LKEREFNELIKIKLKSVSLPRPSERERVLKGADRRKNKKNVSRETVPLRVTLSRKHKEKEAAATYEENLARCLPV